MEYSDFVALSNVEGTPTKYTRELQQKLLHPIPSLEQLQLKYYAEFTPLSSDSSTNEISDIGEDLIVYGALSYASDYFIDERKNYLKVRFKTT